MARGQAPTADFDISHLRDMEVVRGAILAQTGGKPGATLDFMRQLFGGMKGLEEAGAPGMDRAERLMIQSSVFRERGIMGKQAQDLLTSLEKPPGERTAQDIQTERRIVALMEKGQQADEVRGKLGAAELRGEVLRTETGARAMAPEVLDPAMKITSLVSTAMETLKQEAIDAGAALMSVGTGASQAAGALDGLAGKLQGFMLPSAPSGGTSTGVQPSPGGVEEAEGGAIYGPGSETSDSIPANLSHGEYVVKASTVRQLGVPFMDDLNAGRVGFQAGGPADDDEKVKAYRKWLAERRKKKLQGLGAFIASRDPSTRPAKFSDVIAKGGDDKDVETFEQAYRRAYGVSPTERPQESPRGRASGIIENPFYGNQGDLTVAQLSAASSQAQREMSRPIHAPPLQRDVSTPEGRREYERQRREILASAHKIYSDPEGMRRSLEQLQGIGRARTEEERQKALAPSPEIRDLPSSFPGRMEPGVPMPRERPSIGAEEIVNQQIEAIRGAKTEFLEREGIIPSFDTFQERFRGEQESQTGEKLPQVDTFEDGFLFDNMAGGGFASAQRFARGFANGGYVGSFADAAASTRGYAEGGTASSSTGASMSGPEMSGYHQLDIRTNSGSFPTMVSGDTMDALRASTLGSKLSQTGQRPSWYS